MGGSDLGEVIWGMNARKKKLTGEANNG